MNNTIKMVLLGDSTSGKTTLVNRFAYGTCKNNYPTTIGCGFIKKRVEINGKFINIDIWDTSGQERYSDILPMYYRYAAIAIIVYDITNKKSFKTAINWIKTLRDDNINTHIILYGNKTDLDEIRVIDKIKKDFFTDKKIYIIDGSALYDKNVNKSIFDVLSKMDLNFYLERKNENIDISNNNNEKIRYNCCY